METPLLSITIPTYNRLKYLKQTLEVVLSQLTDEVEVIVSDNCSTDGTWEYLGTLGGQVQRFRQDSNVGPDMNMISCLTRAKGEYVWILCDDDLPYGNTVEMILEVITAFQKPPMLFIRSSWKDADYYGFRGQSVRSTWICLDRNRFLESVSYFFTVASSIIVRRDCVDMSFIKQWIGSYLVPTAITLSTVGKHNRVIVPDKPLVICRGGNSSGFDALTVYTRNLVNLLNMCSCMGFDRRVISQVYNENLSGVVLYIVKSWRPLTGTGLLNLFQSSYRYKSFYNRVLPTLLSVSIKRRVGRQWMEMTASFKRSLKPTLKVVITEFYRRYRQTLDRAAVISFTRTVQVVGPGCKVFHPVYLRNPQYVRIGTDFYAGPGLRIEAWDRFQGNQYSPEIIIGNHVAVDYHVHLRAIGRIEIGDNVFIGSHVLITDYSHGQFTHEELEILAPLRPLVSKGPVVIEDNVRIGEGACILSGVRIGRNAVIRANAVVTHNVEPGQTERSVPAQVMGSKNK